MMPKILVFSGSIRANSWNTKLARSCAEMLQEQGASVTVISLADFEMPLFNGDDELQYGLPKAARKLKSMMAAHHGFLIASPEYNGFFTPLLKNTIDWVSRREGDEERLLAFRGKTAAVVSASPGPGGGLRGLPHLRALLSGIGVIVISEHFALKNAASAFGGDGGLQDDMAVQSLRTLSASLVHVTARLAGE